MWIINLPDGKNNFILNNCNSNNSNHQMYILEPIGTFRITKIVYKFFKIFRT